MEVEILDGDDVNGLISEWMDDYRPECGHDAESEAQNLLEQYGPTSNCQTAKLMTNAMRKAIRYLLLTDKDVQRAVYKAWRNEGMRAIGQEWSVWSVEEDVDEDMSMRSVYR